MCQTNAHDGGDPVGPELGQISVDKPAAGAKEASMHLSLTHSDTEGLPKTFLMNVATQNMASMAAFAQTGPCSVSAVGRVFQKFDVVVERGAAGASTSGADGVIDPEYRQLSRMRAKAAATKSRTTQLISQPQFTNLRHPMHIGTTKKRVRRVDVIVGWVMIGGRPARWRGSAAGYWLQGGWLCHMMALAQTPFNGPWATLVRLPAMRNSSDQLCPMCFIRTQRRSDWPSRQRS